MVSRSLIGAVLLSVSLSAQSIPIHGGGIYASPDDWVKKSEEGGQAHWQGLGMTEMAHAVHLECDYPKYGELDGSPFTWTCQVQAFHFPGVVQSIGGDLVAGISWDDGIAPPFAGDPMGLKIVRFHVTFDPQIGWRQGYFDAPHGFNPHGPSPVKLTARVVFEDGTIADPYRWFPVYSVYDLTQAERPLPELQGWGDRAGQSLNTPGDALNAWGDQLIMIRNRRPVQPITSVWPLDLVAFGYGIAGDPHCALRAFKDMDLHHGVTGVEVSTDRYDPAELGPGSHTVTWIFRCDTGEGTPGKFQPNEHEQVLLKTTVMVAGEPPPPPVDCVQGAWYVVSSADTFSAWVTVGDHQERTKTTTTNWQRDIVTPPANGGLACGPSTQTTTSTTVETQPLPPPPCRQRGRGICK